VAFGRQSRRAGWTRGRYIFLVNRGYPYKDSRPGCVGVLLVTRYLRLSTPSVYLYCGCNSYNDILVLFIKVKLFSVLFLLKVLAKGEAVGVWVS